MSNIAKQAEDGIRAASHGEMEWWDAEGFWNKEDFTNSSRIVEMDMNTSLAIFD